MFGIKQLREDLDKLKEQVFIGNEPHSFLDRYFGIARPCKLRPILQNIEFRLDHQEKMQQMLFAYLGIEYAKTTEETATGKREKEVLRKIKKSTH